MGFGELSVGKWSKRLEVFQSTSKLGSAHFELEDDNPGVRRSSRGAMATHEVEPGQGFDDP